METTTRPFWTEREILKHECDQFKSTLKLPALDAAAGEGFPLVEKKTEAKASGSRFESLLARRSLSTTVALALVSPRVLCRRSPSTTVALALVFPRVLSLSLCACVTHTSFPGRPRMLTGRQRTEDNGRSRRSERAKPNAKPNAKAQSAGQTFPPTPFHGSRIAQSGQLGVAESCCPGPRGAHAPIPTLRRGEGGIRARMRRRTCYSTSRWLLTKRMIMMHRGVFTVCRWVCPYARARLSVCLEMVS